MCSLGVQFGIFYIRTSAFLRWSKGRKNIKPSGGVASGGFMYTGVIRYCSSIITGL